MRGQPRNRLRENCTSGTARGVPGNRHSYRRGVWANEGNTMQRVILVTGATGNVGRHVVSQLLDTGAAVRALTRNPASASLPSGVDVVRGDLSVPDTLDACLKGVEAVFLVWPGFAVTT